MNNIDKAFESVKSIGQFSKEYFLYLSSVLNSIDENEINRMAEILN